MFPRLTSGPGGIGREQTARHQRGRLEGAMVAAVAEHGYTETTVSELVGLAGVSKSTFYEHFAGKEECFLATFETIVNEASTRVALAYRSEGGIEERLAAAFSRFAEIVCEETDAASLVVVDSLTLGRAAVEQRERGFAAFELMIHQSFAREPGGVKPSELAVRVIVSGVWSVVYRCMRNGCPDELVDHLEPLVSWALCYGLPEPEPFPLPNRQTPPQGQGSDGIPWDEPPDSPRSREALTQRERIVRAAAQVVAESGYPALSIPAISSAAGTSNQTFYEHFESKEEAFLAAFELLSDRALNATLSAAALERDWRSAVDAGLRGLLLYTLREPFFARLAFFELPAAGPTALDHADATIKRFTTFLQPEAIHPALAPLPPVVVEALGGGLWAAIQHEITRGNLASLPDFAPELAAVTLTPLRPR
jgi:AcrR family transcriptional regulator